MAELEELPLPALAGVIPARYVRLKSLYKGSTLCVASLVTGMNLKTMQQKIDNGEWIENKEWRKGPDGNRYLDRIGYEKWVERGREPQ